MPLLSMAIFVVKEHWARSHHFDFRLEKGCVFKSWAVPKGLPEKPGLKPGGSGRRPMEFGSLQEMNPEGEYGTGSIKVWEHGTYELGSLRFDLSPLLVPVTRSRANIDREAFEAGHVLRGCMRRNNGKLSSARGRAMTRYRLHIYHICHKMYFLYAPNLSNLPKSLSSILRRLFRP